MSKKDSRSTMSQKNDNSPSQDDQRKKILVSKNGPYIVSGRIPLIKKEIRNDADGYCSTWHDVETYPLQEQYALCRCGHSKNKPFCDGTHTKIHFDGTETADDTPYLERAEKITGPALSLTDACADIRKTNPSVMAPIQKSTLMEQRRLMIHLTSSGQKKLPGLPCR